MTADVPPIPEALLAPLLDDAATILRGLAPHEVPASLRAVSGFDARGLARGPARRQLARTLADTGSFAVRGVPTSGYSILYPALLAPAYGLFDSLTDAYAVAKATNAVAMSLAAVPAWLLTRRVAGRWLSLLVAATAVAVPSMAYTATIVTENLFYPLALVVAWTLVRVLERPSAGRIG